jgi:hypothetical protein
MATTRGRIEQDAALSLSLFIISLSSPSVQCTRTFLLFNGLGGKQGTKQTKCFLLVKTELVSQDVYFVVQSKISSKDKQKPCITQ